MTISIPVLVLALTGVFSTIFASKLSPCTYSKPRYDSRLYRIPKLGPGISRINLITVAYVLCIIAFTIWANNETSQDQKAIIAKQDKADAHLETVNNVVRQLEKISEEQQKSLKQSVLQLATIKSNVDSVTKEAEKLNKIGTDTATNLDNSTKALSDTQKHLAESLNILTHDMQEKFNDNLTKQRSILKQQDSAVSLLKLMGNMHVTKVAADWATESFIAQVNILNKTMTPAMDKAFTEYISQVEKDAKHNKVTHSSELLRFNEFHKTIEPAVESAMQIFPGETKTKKFLREQTAELTNYLESFPKDKKILTQDEYTTYFIKIGTLKNFYSTMFEMELSDLLRERTNNLDIEKIKKLVPSTWPAIPPSNKP